MHALPEWMGPQPVSPEWESRARPLRKNRFIRRALAGLVGLVAAPFLGADGAARRGFLTGLDPRAKLLGFLGLIVTTTLLSSWEALALDAVVCLLLAAASRVPAKRLFGAWLAVPMFSALVVLPAALNVVSPGEILVPLGPSVGLTAAGLEVAGRFAARSLLCVTLAALLSQTTRADHLIGGLRALGLSKAFVMLLTMMERYLSVLARAAQEIHLAKLSRTILPGRLRQELAWVAGGAGSLFRRSRNLGNAVYLAMLSRGFTGEMRLLGGLSWSWADVVFVFAMILAGGGLFAVEVLSWPQL
jgi:cobalt/nickel transport system permease protein